MKNNADFPLILTVRPKFTLLIYISFRLALDLSQQLLLLKNPDETSKLVRTTSFFYPKIVKSFKNILRPEESDMYKNIWAHRIA